MYIYICLYLYIYDKVNIDYSLSFNVDTFSPFPPLIISSTLPTPFLVLSLISISSFAMGNAVAPCFHPTKNSEPVKLIFWEGTTKTLSGSRSEKRIAGEIMFEFPDRMVCHADSFFLGRPIPALSIDDELIPGQTYFVLPIDFFPPSSSSGYTLSASSLAAMGSSSSSSSPKRIPLDFGEDGPFQYVKGEDGRLLMKVSPDFIARIIITKCKERERDDAKDRAGDGGSTGSLLCSTPELRKQYEQLVGCREQVWSPKLETITEHRIRYSPCRFFGLEWKQKEKGN